MGSIASGFKKAVGGAAGYLIGSDKTQTDQTVNAAPASPEEQALLKKLLAQTETSTSPTAGSEKDLEAAFKQHLARYLSSSNGQIDPAVLQQASDYVDQTFTNPAQVSFDKFQREYMAKQNEQAAALGRQPMDSSIQQQNFRTLADIQAQMGAERGSRIAQRSDVLGYQRPMEQMGFINDLNQQAFQNRLGLMNLQSGLYNNMQNYRLATAGRSTIGLPSDKGVLGGLTGIVQGASGFAKAIKSFGSNFGGVGGGGGDIGSGQYNIGSGGGRSVENM